MSEQVTGKHKPAKHPAGTARRGAPIGNRNAAGNVGGPGAEPKYDAETHPERAFKFALLGMTDRQLAAALEIGETTLNAWKRAHPEFAARLRDGKDPADAEVAAGLWERAKNGDPQAGRYWLNNRRRHAGTWAERQELSGPNGGPIPVEQSVATIDVRLLTPDEREELREAMNVVRRAHLIAAERFEERASADA